MSAQLVYDHPLDSGIAPGWAEEWGQDRHGVWAAFVVGDVAHRMRWIPPGRFWMGSEDGEGVEWIKEWPRHLVRITSGFWLGETPCTQELWGEVTGGNPSRFKHPKRPVERVSWDDVQGFLEELNEGMPDLECSLPTEAQWEHACRAGTHGPDYGAGCTGRPVGGRSAGGPIARGRRRLGEIGWYSKNSRDDFELKGWTRRGTHPVGLKEPNAWGLRDMLGNVWEWCADGPGEYDKVRLDDPAGPVGNDESRRVVRGGSWHSPARRVRAACRLAYDRRDADVVLGFRLSRGQGSRASSCGTAEPV